MSEREDERAAFLRAAGIEGRTLVPLARDASSRSYARIGGGLILMDAPGAEGIAAFVAMARLLREAGLCAPEAIAEDIETGFLLLEDLGPVDVATVVRDAPDAEVTGAVADGLIRLAQIEVPEGLIRMTPTVGAEMLEPLRAWYPGARDVGALAVELERVLATAGPPDVLSLRDFHAENLIWRAERSGLDRLGLLDFQDAFAAPLGYDLASYVRDVRRDVMAREAATLIARVSGELGWNRDDFAMAVAVLGVQRNLRILGVFARLAARDGKRRYLEFMPRVRAHIAGDLAILGDGALSDAVRAAMPEGEI